MKKHPVVLLAEFCSNSMTLVQVENLEVSQVHFIYTGMAE